MQQEVLGPLNFKPKRYVNDEELEKDPDVRAGMANVLLPKKVSKEALRQLYLAFYYGTSEVIKIPTTDLLDRSKVVVKSTKSRYQMASPGQRKISPPEPGVHELLSSISTVEASILTNRLGGAGEIPYWFADTICDKEFYCIILETLPAFIQFAKSRAEKQVPATSGVDEVGEKARKMLDKAISQVDAGTRRVLGYSYQNGFINEKITSTTAEFKNIQRIAEESDPMCDARVLNLLRATGKICDQALNGEMIKTPREYVEMLIRNQHGSNQNLIDEDIKKMPHSPRDDLLIDDNLVSVVQDIVKQKKPSLGSTEGYDFSGYAMPNAYDDKKPALGSSFVSYKLKGKLTINDCLELIEKGATLDPRSNSLVLPNGDKITENKIIDFLNTDVALRLLRNAEEEITAQYGIPKMAVDIVDPVSHTASDTNQMMLRAPSYLLSNISSANSALANNREALFTGGLAQYCRLFCSDTQYPARAKEIIFSQPLLCDREFAAELIRSDFIERYCSSEEGKNMANMVSGVIYGKKMTPDQLKLVLSSVCDKLLTGNLHSSAVEALAVQIMDMHSGVLFAVCFEEIDSRGFHRGNYIDGLCDLLDVAQTVCSRDGMFGLLASCQRTQANNMILLPKRLESRLADQNSTAAKMKKLIHKLADVLGYTAVEPGFLGWDPQPNQMGHDAVDSLLFSICTPPFWVLTMVAAQRLQRHSVKNAQGESYLQPLLAMYTAIIILVLSSDRKSVGNETTGRLLARATTGARNPHGFEGTNKNIAYGRLLIILRNILCYSDTLDITDADTSFETLTEEICSDRKGELALMLAMVCAKATAEQSRCTIAFFKMCDIFATIFDREGTPGCAIFARTLRDVPPVEAIKATTTRKQPIRGQSRNIMYKPRAIGNETYIGSGTLLSDKTPEIEIEGKFGQNDMGRLLANSARDARLRTHLVAASEQTGLQHLDFAELFV